MIGDRLDEPHSGHCSGTRDAEHDDLPLAELAGLKLENKAEHANTADTELSSLSGLSALSRLSPSVAASPVGPQASEASPAGSPLGP